MEDPNFQSWEPHTAACDTGSEGEVETEIGFYRPAEKGTTKKETAEGTRSKK